MSDEKSEVAEIEHIRRRDLTDLGNKFSHALAPVATLVEVTKQNTAQAARTEQTVRMTRRTSTIIALLVCVGILGIVYLSKQIARTAAEQAVTARAQSVLIKEVKKLQEATENTKAAVVQEAERAQKQPSVQLVPELDPEKAKSTPMKLIIETSGGAPKDTTEVTVPEPPVAPGTSSGKRSKVEIPISQESL